MIRIVIADDHTIMREGLKRILEGADDIEVVGEAVDGFEVLAQVRKGGFDLLMLDLSMPGRSGVELIRQIDLIEKFRKLGFNDEFAETFGDKEGYDAVISGPAKF